MYIAHTLQLQNLIKNAVKSIETENRYTIETSIRSKLAFQNEEDRRTFYRIYDRNDESQRIAHNIRKVTTIYCAPKYRNLLAIHLLSTFSLDLDTKYLIEGTHQRFSLSPGYFLVYQPHRDFSAQLSNSGRISIIATIAETIYFLILEIFHYHLSLYSTSTPHPFPLNIIFNMPILGQYKSSSLIQYGRHSKMGNIFPNTP